MRKKGKGKINGPFYPWLIEMGSSLAMNKLRKNSEAINVLTMFISKYTYADEGKNLCATYREARPFMSNSTFAKAKLWCTAFGFLHCTRFGRLERNSSIYRLSGKWRHLSGQPEKLDHIEQLLKRHEEISRTAANNISEKTWKNSSEEQAPISAKDWKARELRKIELEILKQ